MEISDTNSRFLGYEYTVTLPLQYFVGIFNDRLFISCNSKIAKYGDDDFEIILFCLKY